MKKRHAGDALLNPLTNLGGRRKQDRRQHPERRTAPKHEDGFLRGLFWNYDRSR